MRNVNRPSGLQFPFIDVKKAMLSPSEINSLLVTHNIQEVFRKVSAWVPNSLNHPQYTVQPPTWGDALKIPGSLQSRMYWAAVMFDALRAEILENRLALNNILEQRQEEAMAAAEGSSSTSSMNQGPDQVDDGEHFGDDMSGASTTEDDPWHDPAKAAAIGSIWILAYQNAYAASMEAAHEELAGMGLHLPDEHMTPEQVDEYSAAHAVDTNYVGLQRYLAGQIGGQSQQLELESVGFAQKFLSGVTAMLHKAGNEVNAVEQAFSNHAEAAPKLGSALDNYIIEMKKLTNEMTQEVEKELAAATGNKPKPGPTPPTAADFNAEVAGMGGPQNSQHQMTQWRIALIRLMFPNAPRPPAVLREKLDEAAGVPPAKTDQHEGLKAELHHFAQVLSVDVQLLEKAADGSFAKMFPNAGQELRDALSLHSDAPSPEVSKTLIQRMMEKAMKPGAPQNP